MDSHIVDLSDGDVNGVDKYGSDKFDVDKSCLALLRLFSHALAMSDEERKIGELRQHCIERLVALRKEKNLSQSAVAERAGVHRSYVSHVERGYRKLTLDAFELFMRAVCGQDVHDKPALNRRVVERLRSYRLERGLSQEALSSLAGFSPNFVGRLERGQVQTTIDNIERLTNHLMIDAESLLDSQQGETPSTS